MRTSGAGLGLSITRGLVEGMGGRVTVRNADDDEEESGLIVSLALPLAA